MENLEDNTTQNNESNNEFIDNITLELLMNKGQYNKYISKKHPEKYEKVKDFQDKIYKYKYDIIDLTKELLENPEKEIANEVNDIFEAYAKKLIHFFEMKEIETENLFTPRPYNDDKEDDMMFEKIDEPVTTSVNYGDSLWGKRITKK
jgi:hypothetical protein